MSDTSMFRFLLYLNTNPEAKARVAELETKLTKAMRDEADAIAAIATDAGFDAAEWNIRPGTPAADGAAFSSCCGFMTSGTWQVERAL